MPCGEILVTSRPEVPSPSGSELIRTPFDDLFNLPKLPSRHAVVSRQLHPWFKPELRFPAGTMHMDVHPGFFQREEKEPVSPFPENSWRHRPSLACKGWLRLAPPARGTPGGRPPALDHAFNASGSIAVASVDETERKDVNMGVEVERGLVSGSRDPAR